jgi:GT2 family glycosyltransferase
MQTFEKKIRDRIQTMQFSIVIPTFARPDRLARCLGCVKTQHLPADSLEIIVTDDSPDEITRKMLARDFPRVRWTQGPQRGPAANRNHGASLASGEWIVFLDDDVEAEPGWLDAMAAAIDGADVIEGKTVCPGKRDHPFEEHVENLTGGNLWSCNMAIRHDCFQQLGGFDEDFPEAGGEDMEFAWRVNRDRLCVVFVPEATVLHPPRRITWRGLWKRTWMIRWIALYRVKTGVRSRLVRDTCMDLLRTTVHLVSRFDRSCWRSRLFYQVWKWLTFPLVLPYLAAWEFYFRCRAKKTAAR